MSWQIPVFKAERDAGLQELVRAKSSVSYAALAQLAEPKQDVAIPNWVKAKVRGLVKAAANDQPDLHFLKTLLVTTGVNKNDDAFDTLETWAARHSPEHKPFNYNHVGDDIIGHITSCGVYMGDVKVGESKLELVVDDTTPDDLPEKFHIVTSAVLYKFWEDEALQERMDTTLAEIAKGEWFVSMEALFKGFDYLLIDPSAKGSASHKIVARNKETAFLTKHLRVMGGDGVYQKYRVCRLLRNITFSGKGLVRKPANADSIIFDETETFAAAAGQIIDSTRQLEYSTPTQRITQESKTMAAENTDTLAAENAALKNQVATLQAGHDLKAAKAQIDSLTVEVNGMKSRLEAGEQKTKAADEEVAAWKTKYDELQKSAEASAKELGEVKASQAKATRVSLLVKKLDMDDAKASEMADKLTYLKDDEFAAHAEYLAEKLTSFKQAAASGQQTPAKLPPTQTNKPAPMGGNPTKVKTLAAESDPAAVNADPKVLEDVQSNGQPALATAQADEGVEKTRAAVAAYMADYFDMPADETEAK